MPDPGLEINGGRSPRPLDKGEGGRAQSPKKFFSALRASVWSKNKRGPAPLDPPLIAVRLYSQQVVYRVPNM